MRFVKHAAFFWLHVFKTVLYGTGLKIVYDNLRKQSEADVHP